MTYTFGHVALVSDVPKAYILTANKPLVDALLAMNTSNRKVRQTAVARLRTDIEGGHWHLTASGIGVDSRGITSDGQHRLLAIKEAGYPPIQFVLVTGLHPDAQAVVDRHAKRSLADALSLVRGRTISTAIIAASNVLLSIKNATVKDEPFTNATGGGQPSDSRAAANLVLWEDDLTAVMSAIGSSVRSSVVAAVAIYYRHDSERALEFADQIKRGIGLHENDPAYRLRNVLANGGALGGASGSMRAFCYGVSAIIAHSQDRQIKLLRPAESWTTATWRPWKA